MKFYKILNESECLNGLQFHDGWNVDPLPWNPNGSCKSDGIYFAGKDILAFLFDGPWIREVKDHDKRIYRDPGPPEKFKSPRVFLGPRKRISFGVIKKLVKEGANIHAGNERALRFVAANGHLKIVQYFVDYGADIHACDDSALCLAAMNNRLDIVQYLVGHGANIHADKDGALRWAATKGHLKIVQYLVSHGADVHADKEGALCMAAANDHVDVVRYLVNHGANIHADKDNALRMAARYESWNAFQCLLAFIKEGKQK